MDRDRSLAEWWAAGRPQRRNVDFQFSNDPTQGIAMHAQILGSPKLIRFPLSQDRKNEDPLELAYGLEVSHAAPIHLQHQFLELFFHRGLPLSSTGSN